MQAQSLSNLKTKTPKPGVLPWEPLPASPPTPCPQLSETKLSLGGQALQWDLQETWILEHKDWEFRFGVGVPVQTLFWASNRPESVQLFGSAPPGFSQEEGRLMPLRKSPPVPVSQGSWGCFQNRKRPFQER